MEVNIFSLRRIKSKGACNFAFHVVPRLGEIEKYKAKVVAKGLSQVEGINYDQTFSPPVRFEIIW